MWGSCPLDCYRSPKPAALDCARPVATTYTPSLSHTYCALSLAPFSAPARSGFYGARTHAKAESHHMFGSPLYRGRLARQRPVGVVCPPLRMPSSPRLTGV